MGKVMDNFFETSSPSFDELAAALPFYLNGTLAKNDIVIVENALELMPALREELSQCRQIYDFALENRAAISSPRAHDPNRLEKLISRIDKLEQHETATAPVIQIKQAPLRILSNIKKFFELPNIGFALASLLLVQSFVVLWLLNTRDNETSFTSIENSQEFTLQIAPTTSWVSVQNILDESQFEIIGLGKAGEITLKSKSKIRNSELQYKIAELQKSFPVGELKLVSNVTSAKTDNMAFGNGPICLKVKNDSLFWGHPAAKTVNLAQIFRTIDTIDGEISGTRENAPATIKIEKQAATKNWSNGGYYIPAWGPTSGWKSYFNWANEENPREMTQFSKSNIMDHIDVRFGVNDGIFPGKAIIPQGEDSLYLVQRNISYTKGGKVITPPNAYKSIRIENFELNICGQQRQ